MCNNNAVLVLVTRLSFEVEFHRDTVWRVISQITGVSSRTFCKTANIIAEKWNTVTKILWLIFCLKMEGK